MVRAYLGIGKDADESDERIFAEIPAAADGASAAAFPKFDLRKFTKFPSYIQEFVADLHEGKIDELNPILDRAKGRAN